MAINIKALMALSAANVAPELWHWESPLMGGQTSQWRLIHELIS